MYSVLMLRKANILWLKLLNKERVRLPNGRKMTNSWIFSANKGRKCIKDSKQVLAKFENDFLFHSFFPFFFFFYTYKCEQFLYLTFNIYVFIILEFYLALMKLKFEKKEKFFMNVTKILFKKKTCFLSILRLVIIRHFSTFY